MSPFSPAARGAWASPPYACTSPSKRVLQVPDRLVWLTWNLVLARALVGPADPCRRAAARATRTGPRGLPRPAAREGMQARLHRHPGRHQCRRRQGDRARRLGHSANPVLRAGHLGGRADSDDGGAGAEADVLRAHSSEAWRLARRPSREEPKPPRAGGPADHLRPHGLRRRAVGWSNCPRGRAPQRGR